ncbi:coiled-coil domain-containing protein 157-like [Gracilinanus agilis]|uniref:coiled-coil domain-containing protein 157-like n=1 Tax=Gracilinanus agilis TaxID=191870 RepID=UPI001CFCD2CE|nr:coiled-coil domain-containing protein 157-like [Gracilinanus agilis]
MKKEDPSLGGFGEQGPKASPCLVLSHFDAPRAPGLLCKGFRAVKASGPQLKKTKQDDSPNHPDQSEAAENKHPIIPEFEAFEGSKIQTARALTPRLLASCSLIPDFPGLRQAQATSPPGHSVLSAAPTYTRSVHTQTIDTALIPCDACGRVQWSLREVSKAIISLCANQNLPSSLDKFQHLVQETMGQQPMSAVDLSYWAAEQSKDLGRISKHLGTLMQVISPLRAQLEEAERQKQQLQQQLEELGQEMQKEKVEQQQQQANKEREQELVLVQLQEEKQELLSEISFLKKTLDTLTGELKQNQDIIQDLAGWAEAPGAPSVGPDGTSVSVPRAGCLWALPPWGAPHLTVWGDGGYLPEAKKQQMLDDMSNMVKKSEAKQLEARVQLLTGRLENASQQFGWASTELDKEKAKVDSMIRHQESLQAKQRALLQQLDSLDQEREELRASLEESETQQANLEGQLQAANDAKNQVDVQLQAQQELLQSLQQEKQAMEQATEELQMTVYKLDKSILELKERERLLVAFPDLHVPSEAQFESSGNVAEDMERQVQANVIRMQVLEEENGRLRATLTKLQEVARQGGLKLVPEAQVWSSPSKGTQTGSCCHPRRTSPGHLGVPTGHRDRPASSRLSSESSPPGRPFRPQPARPNTPVSYRSSRPPLTVTGSSKTTGSNNIAYMELRGKGSGKRHLGGSAQQLR